MTHTAQTPRSMAAPPNYANKHVKSRPMIDQSEPHPATYTARKDEEAKPS